MPADGQSPWDFILMIEGALLFAAASVKRLESCRRRLARFIHFCVSRQSGRRIRQARDSERRGRTLRDVGCRCGRATRLWLNCGQYLAKGRAQVGGRPARNGVDFARAAVTLGVDRTASSPSSGMGFRFAMGLHDFATPLERIPVRRNARVRLLADIDQMARPVAPESRSEGESRSTGVDFHGR